MFVDWMDLISLDGRDLENVCIKVIFMDLNCT